MGIKSGLQLDVLRVRTPQAGGEDARVNHSIQGVLTLSPADRLQLALETLDLGWTLGIAGEMAAGAGSAEEAEARLARRWQREDALRLRQKLEKWRSLDRARRQDT